MNTTTPPTIEQLESDIALIKNYVNRLQNTNVLNELESLSKELRNSPWKNDLVLKSKNSWASWKEENIKTLIFLLHPLEAQLKRAKKERDNLLALELGELKELKVEIHEPSLDDDISEDLLNATLENAFDDLTLKINSPADFDLELEIPDIQMPVKTNNGLIFTVLDDKPIVPEVVTTPVEEVPTVDTVVVPEVVTTPAEEVPTVDTVVVPEVMTTPVEEVPTVDTVVVPEVVTTPVEEVPTVDSVVVPEVVTTPVEEVPTVDTVVVPEVMTTPVEEVSTVDTVVVPEVVTTPVEEVPTVDTVVVPEVMTTPVEEIPTVETVVVPEVVTTIQPCKIQISAYRNEQSSSVLQRLLNNKNSFVLLKDSSYFVFDSIVVYEINNNLLEIFDTNKQKIFSIVLDNVTLFK